LQKEFSAISEEEETQLRPFILQRLTRKLASKRHPPQEVDRYAKRYDEWLLPILATIGTTIGLELLKSAASEGVSAISKAISSGTGAPVAPALAPPKKMSPEEKFRWPIDDPTATAQYTPGAQTNPGYHPDALFPRMGILLTLQRNLDVSAAGNGTIRLVEQKHIRFHRPFFLIRIDHTIDYTKHFFQTFYTGWGSPLVKQGVQIKAQHQIAKTTGRLLYFRMRVHGVGELVDPRSHLPSFPGSMGPDLTQAAPAVRELINLSCLYYQGIVAYYRRRAAEARRAAEEATTRAGKERLQLSARDFDRQADAALLPPSETVRRADIYNLHQRGSKTSGAAK
jgi:hypothetical protein